MNWVYLFTSAEGRISRKPFWIAVAVLAAVEIAIQWVAQHIQGERLGIVLDLAFTYPEFMLSVKRANDRNMSSIIVGAFFATAVLINFMVLLGWSGSIADQNPLFTLVLYAWGIFAVIMLIELGFRRGTPGPNRFGPDPLV